MQDNKTMHRFMCSLETGDLQLIEHEAARWLSLEDIDSVKWLPAYLLVVEALKKEMKK